MAYQVDKFNGEFLVSVADGTIDNTTDLRLVGKNYAGYGELQNENFVHLLENFANATPPPKAILGQIWYDSSTRKLKYYNGSKFKIAGGAEVSSTAPSGLETGEFWWDSTNKQLYAWSGTDFELVGPDISTESGQSAVNAVAVDDNQLPAPDTKLILKAIVAGQTVAVIGNDDFILSDEEQTLTPGFENIKPGITLPDSTQGDYKFWGTATNSEQLGGEPASSYIRADQLTSLPNGVRFTNDVKFDDAGFTVGNLGNEILRIYVDTGVPVIENRASNSIEFRVTDAETSTVAVVSTTGILPGVPSANLGSSSIRWNTVFANTISGNVTGNITGNTTGTHKGNVESNDSSLMIDAVNNVIGYSDVTIRGQLEGTVTGNLIGTATNADKLTNFDPSITAAANTVAVRDSSGRITANEFVGTTTNAEKLTNLSPATSAAGSTVAVRDSVGNLSAVLFQGTATSARYADLAEKYLADKDYEPGTVVIVGGKAEVTASLSGKRAIGVVSTDPAFMMNSELEGGTYIALKGRVPVRVHGTVNKGDCLRPGDNGYAVSTDVIHSLAFAVALESSDSEYGIIEAVIL